MRQNVLVKSRIWKLEKLLETSDSFLLGENTEQIKYEPNCGNCSSSGRGLSRKRGVSTGLGK